MDFGAKISSKSGKFRINWGLSGFLGAFQNLERHLRNFFGHPLGKLQGLTLTLSKARRPRNRKNGPAKGLIFGLGGKAHNFQTFWPGQFFPSLFCAKVFIERLRVSGIRAERDWLFVTGPGWKAFGPLRGRLDWYPDLGPLLHNPLGAHLLMWPENGCSGPPNGRGGNSGIKI